MGQYYIINEVDVQKGVDYLNKAFSMKNAEAGLFLSDVFPLPLSSYSSSTWRENMFPRMCPKPGVIC